MTHQEPFPSPRWDRLGKLRSFLYAGGLCSLVGLAVLGVEIEPASASTNPLEQELPEALMSSALEEPDPQPSSTAAVLSTCDPDDYYSQFCCDLLDAANQAQSPDDMEMAWLRCDPSLTVTNPGQGGDDCIDGHVAARLLVST